jgi:hypothetical protein
MAQMIIINSHNDARGSLSVLEAGSWPFTPQRLFYIYDVPAATERGGHGHYKTRMLLIGLCGKITVTVKTKAGRQEFRLTEPQQALLLEPEEWHTMHFEEEGSLLLVLASEPYSKADYFYEEP